MEKNESSKDNARQLSELLQALTALDPTEREELLKETGVLPEIANLGIRADHISRLQKLFPTLAPHQASALTLDDQYSPGFFHGEVVSQLADYLHAQDDAFEIFSEAYPFCGALGKKVLLGARDRVNRIRREANQALIPSLMALHDHLLAENKDQTEKVDKQFAQAINQATRDFAAEEQRESGDIEQKLIFANMTAKHVRILRECITFVREQYPSIYWGDTERFLAMVMRLYCKHRRKGYGPISGRRSAKIQKDPRQLYEDPAGGPPKWGGKHPSITKEETSYQYAPAERRPGTYFGDIREGDPQRQPGDLPPRVIPKTYLNERARPKLSPEMIFGAELTDKDAAIKAFAAGMGSIVGLPT